jgi:hypothetical protein
MTETVNEMFEEVSGNDVLIGDIVTYANENYRIGERAALIRRVEIQANGSRFLWGYWKEGVNEIQRKGKRMRFIDTSAGSKIYRKKRDQEVAQQTATPTEQTPATAPAVPDALLEMKFTRSAEGVRVWIKSPVLEDYFKQASNGREQSYGSIPHWDVPDAMKSKFSRAWSAGISVLTYDGEANPRPLLRKGLGEGITHVATGLHTTSEIESVARKYKDMVKSLYLNYIKPVEITVKLRVEQTELVA